MVKILCDCCYKDIENDDVIDYLNAVKLFMVDHTLNDVKVKDELVLCNDCKQKFYYFIRNPAALRAECESLTLTNRIRFLLKKPLKEKK